MLRTSPALFNEVRKDNPETSPFKGCELPALML
jgi:hypothetical protein